MNKDKQESYLRATERLAERFSKDQSTKVGSMVLGTESCSPVSFGYNGMPRGLDDNNVERNTRPEKYLWIEHAERNAIYNKARDVLEGRLMLTTRLPNMDSARAIVQSGLATLVINEVGPNATKEQQEMNARVKTLFQETGVTLVDLSRFPANTPDKFVSKVRNYLEFSQEIADDLSKDPDEKLTAIILNEKTFAPISFGYNGMPRGLDDYNQERLTPEEKPFWIEDAERNAIFNAVRPLFEQEPTTVFASFMPCMHCARALISVGIKQVITRPLDMTQEKDQRWKSSFERSAAIFHEAGVDVIALPHTEPENTKKAKP